MSLFHQINEAARQRPVSYLVIGGLAVNFHGCSRDTADLDLLIDRDTRDAWLSMLGELGYSVFHDGGAFIQMSAPEAGAWPVDLMLVRESTFRPMLENAREVEMYGVHLKIPSLEHLIALKLHALKHSHAGRFLKDFLDVENLVRANRMDLDSEPVRQWFLKYGNLELYEKISLAASGK